MPTHCVFGVLTSREHAAGVIKDASRAGFSTNDMSVLVPESPGDTTLGLLSGLVAVEIPGLQPLQGAGPLIATLAGWSTAGVAHGLISLKISEALAHTYEQRIAGGAILVSIQTEQAKDVDRLKAIFLQQHAEEVGVSEPKEVSAINARPSRPPSVIAL